MKKNKLRGFVSITLFFCMIILLISAIGIEVIETIISPEIRADWLLNPANQDLYFLGRMKPFVTGAHVISGYLLVVFSVIHMVKNSNALKSYFGIRKIKTNQNEIRELESSLESTKIN